MAAAVIGLGTTGSAQAWGFDDNPMYQGRQSRAAQGYSAAPEVAARPRRARTTRIVRSEEDDAPRARAHRATRTRVASLKSRDDSDSGGYSARPKVGGGHGGVSWVASGGCLPGSLRSVISDVSQYGRVVVSSTGRDHARNRAAGGAQHSYHLSCQAADFRVHGNVASAASYLRNHGSVGGFHHYGGGLFHIDTGPKRTW